MASLGVGSRLNVNQTTVGGTAVELVPGRTVRKSVKIQNLDTTATDFLYIGSSSAVTTANGYRVAAAGGEITLNDYNGSVWAIATTASTPVGYLEVY
jgi:hypothetical protein